MELTRSLTAAERERITARLADIEAALAERDPRTVERSIAGMMLSIPSGRASGDEARAIVSAYVNALSDVPVWAVNDAANRFARGQVKSSNPAFPPSGAEVHQEAMRIATPYRGEAVRLRQLLAGTVANRQVPRMSRERLDVDSKQAQAAAAKLALEKRAHDLGVTVNLDDIEEPGDRGTGPFQSLAVPVPTRKDEQEAA